MTVLVLHTLPPAGPPERSPYEFDLSETAAAIAEAIPEARVVGVRGEVSEIVEAVASHRPAVVFNLCEAPLGRSDLEAHAAAVLEWLGVRFTGCGSETLALCRRKDRTRAVLTETGIPVPPNGVFPCIVKPADEDASVHIDLDSVCETETQMACALARLPGRAVIEAFIPGREFMVALWGRDEPDNLSYCETRFLNGLRLSTYVSKWEEGSQEFLDSPYCYSTLESELRNRIFAVAVAAWRAVGARGYLTVDIRLDASNRPFVLDINPNPNLGVGVGIVRAAEEVGWTWEGFLRRQIEWA
ncbi:ATP-grasp domain-containing protein [Bosea sp. Tri-44]|uniref:ATP-grasp domain-containing protein n=1 Tax=Bosea sp. Tri-44 TaxID=1972137 RepID=UPI0013E924FC|nr:ATP-grasp domain-containing protein [Bosea sp. Tri-44]